MIMLMAVCWYDFKPFTYVYIYCVYLSYFVINKDYIKKTQCNIYFVFFHLIWLCFNFNALHPIKRRAVVYVMSCHQPRTQLSRTWPDVHTVQQCSECCSDGYFPLMFINKNRDNIYLWHIKGASPRSFQRLNVIWTLYSSEITCGFKMTTLHLCQWSCLKCLITCEC